MGQKGQEPDEEFDGPMKKRGCTDIICLLIFISFIGGMVRSYLLFLIPFPVFNPQNDHNFERNEDRATVFLK